MQAPMDDFSGFDLIDDDLLQRHMAHHTVGCALVGQSQATSTMDMATEAVRERACESGTVFVVEQQTAGRGRRGRSWVTPPGRALLMSVVLRPSHYGLPLALAPMLAGVALVDALVEVAPELAGQVWLKWPNDLLIGEDPAQAGKAGGILVESSLRGDGALDHLIVGIGVNVNHSREELPPVSPPALPPTSVQLALGRPLRRSLLLVAICVKLEAWLTRPALELSAAWRDRLGTLGKQIVVYGHERDSTPLMGEAVDVSDAGALMVRDGAGSLHTVYAGDVSVRSRAAGTHNGA